MTITNIILTVFIIVRLRVPPAEVLENVKGVHAQVVHNTGLIQAEIEKSVQQLERIQTWMEETDNVVAERTRDRVYKRQLDEWISNLKKDNPEISVPDFEPQPADLRKVTEQ